MPLTTGQPPGSGPTRRAVGKALAGALLVATPGRGRAAGPAGTRAMVALDWAAAETALALGVVPAGVAERPRYNATVCDPALPDSVVDVGLRLFPNTDLLRAFAPALLLINGAQAYMAPQLQDFGSVVEVKIFTDALRPLEGARNAVLQLGTLLGRTAEAPRVLAACDVVMDAARARLSGFQGRSFYLFSFIDGRHIAICGAGSLPGAVLGRLGLRNAWRVTADDWGVSTVGLEQLTADPEAGLVHFGPLSAEVERRLDGNLLWRALLARREGRAVTLPGFWPYGGVPSAMRFARLLSEGLAGPS